MSRADNQLLEACLRVHKRTAIYSVACGAAVGFVWFLCVAIRAGALWSN